MPKPSDDPPEVIGKLQDLRADRAPMTPEELECYELAETIKRACAKGDAQRAAVLKALSEATGMSALLVEPLAKLTPDEKQRAIDVLSAALGCGVLLFPHELKEVISEAVRRVNAELRAGTSGVLN